MRNNRIVFVNGCFDVIHVGHVHLLQFARGLGTELIVALNEDESVRRLKGKNRPINPLAERRLVLEALECVDRVFTFPEDNPLPLLMRMRGHRNVVPSVFVKGSDYRGKSIPEEAFVREVQGTLVYYDKTGHSTSDITRKAAALR